MQNWILWSLAFLALWWSFIWIFLLFNKEKTNEKIKKFPKISIAIPCHNDAKTILKTIKNLEQLDWPKNKIEFIVANNGSTDDTEKILKSLKKENKKIKILNLKVANKALALNCALDVASGEYFACLDADCIVDSKALKEAIKKFDKKTGAVIANVMPVAGKGFWRILQMVEYAFANLLRYLATSIGTLGHVHGALSIFKTGLLRQLGGFKTAALTEDVEIALRLRKAGYDIKMAWAAKTYTEVPNSWQTLWRQRMRWYRGWLSNHYNYKEMFFNNKYGLFGTFQLPISALSIIVLILNVSIIIYNGIKESIEFLIRNLTIKNYLINHVFQMPTLEEILLGQNFHIYLPILFSSIAGLYILLFSLAKQKIFKDFLKIPIYILTMPFVAALHWIFAIVYEFFGFKRSW